MLSAIVMFSLRHRRIVVTISFLLIAYGIYAVIKSKYDVFPEFAPPVVSIQTESPGLAPEQVEALVTQPIENAIVGVPGIESLRSGSIQGLSVITLTFSNHTDIYRARQLVGERLSGLNVQLPQGVQAPEMTPLTSSTSVVFGIGLTSSSRSLMELRTIADWMIKPGLLSAPGVSKVAVLGGDVKQMQIQVNPGRLIEYELGIEDVITAARQATAARGAGFVENENQRITVRTEGQPVSAEDIGKTIVTRRKGVNLTLDRVAAVREAPAPRIGSAAINGRPGIIMTVSSQFGANTLEVTRALEERLREMQPALAKQDIQLHSDVFRPANFIETALRNIRFSLILGAILVAVVLFLFMGDIRNVVVSFMAIPLSLLCAVILLRYLGFSLNTMTIGGLAIAIGEVVDDAIIDVENILRRLKENRQSGSPKSSLRVVFEASLEVRGAVVYATFAVVLVFVPVLTMSGVAGRLFAPLGVAYILAILASLAVALTVTPAMSMLIFPSRAVRTAPRFVSATRRHYSALIEKLQKRPGKVIASAVVLTLAGACLLPFFKEGFLPDFKESHFIIHLTAAPGTSLHESLNLGSGVTRDLLKIPYVRSVAQSAGRAEMADEVLGPHSSEFDVELKAVGQRETDAALADMRKIVARYPGVNSTIKSFLSERVEETLSGYTAPVVINIFGDELGMLDRKAREVALLLNRIRGAAEVLIQSPPGTPQLVIRFRPFDVRRWGFNPLDLQEAISAAYEGAIVGQIYRGNQVYDVSVILEPALRKNIDSVAALPLRNQEGAYVQLSQLADIHQSGGRYVVLHDGARRVQTVTCNVIGRNIGSFMAEVRKNLSTVSFPPGSHVEYAGEAVAQSRSRWDLIFHSLIAGIGIVLLLSALTGEPRSLLLILVNLPFALAGGVFAAFLTGDALSVGSMVGFVTLFGITLRNSIMMVTHYQHLTSTEGMEWGLPSAIRGASERLTPILMTALVTALGLAPLAAASGTAGREIEGPMAVVILGGLITSTCLNLLVLPTLALRYGRFHARQQREADNPPASA